MVNVFGFLIILGAILFFFARRQVDRKRRPVREQKEIQASTDQLKKELERSADAIIHRMGTHVSQLEKLIQEADARTAALDSRIAECRRLEAELEIRTAELSQRAQQAVAAAQIHTAAVSQKIQPPVERVDAQDFAAVLHDSLERDEREHASMAGRGQAAGLQAAVSGQTLPQGTVPYASPIEEDVSMQVSGPAREEAEEEEPSGEASAVAHARALLLSGYSVEDTARETGLGKGAVKLVQEMSRHAMEEAEKDRP